MAKNFNRKFKQKLRSPLSNNQEVSADGEGTKWKVVCEGATEVNKKSRKKFLLIDILKN